MTAAKKTKGRQPPRKDVSYATYRRRYRTEHQAKVRASLREIGPTPPKRDRVRAAKFEGDLLGFLGSYLRHRFPLKFSQDHLDLIDSTQGIILHGGLRALALPRGSGKTTILEGACLWALLYGHRRFLFVVAATGKAAKAIMDNLQQELATNDDLFADFPEACHAIRAINGVSQRAEAQTTDGKPTHLVWTSEEVRLPFTAAGGGSVIQIASITGSMRGAKATLADGTQIRPDICLMDDFQTRESAKSAIQTANRIQIIQSDVLGLAGPGERVAAFCACTIIQRGDGAAQLLDRKRHPEWQGTTARLMRSMPSAKAMALWDRYTEIYREDLGNELLPQDRKLARATAFYRKNRAAMDDGAVAAWAERKSDGELSAVQHAMDLLITRGEEAFYAEYQNDPRGLAAADTLPQLEADLVARRLNRIKPGLVPTGTVKLVGFIDVGEHVFWYHAGAFADGFRGDSVAYGAYPDPGRKFFTKTECIGLLAKAHPTGSREATWYAGLTALCGQLLNREWQGEDGTNYRISLLLIDAGFGESTDTVFDFCKRSEFKDRVLPSMGRGLTAKGRPMSTWKKEKGDIVGIDWRVQRNTSRKQKEVVFNANHWKCFVADRLTSPVGGRSCFSLAGEKPEEHEMLAAHCCAEKRVRVSAAGRTVDEWSDKPGQDNDLWDTTVGIHVAASIEGITIMARPTADAAPLSFAEQQRLAREKRTA